MRKYWCVVAVEDFAASIEDSTKHLLTDANSRCRTSQRDRIASPQAGNVTQRQQQCLLIAKADHFRFGESLRPAMDTTQRADRHGKIRSGNRQSAEPSHTSGQSDRDNFRDLFRECEHD